MVTPGHRSMTRFANRYIPRGIPSLEPMRKFVLSFSITRFASSSETLFIGSPSGSKTIIGSFALSLTSSYRFCM